MTIRKIDSWFTLSSNGRSIAQSENFEKLLKGGKALCAPFEIHETTQWGDATTTNEIKYREYLEVLDYRD